MSIQYVANNSETAINAFYKKYYYFFVTRNYADIYGNLVDFNFAEKFLYGRVDYNFVPIVYDLRFREEKYIKFNTTETTPPTAAPFVVDAFNDLCMQFRKALVANQIGLNEGFLSDFKCERAYKSPKRLHAEHVNSIVSGIAHTWRQENVVFKNFEEFMPLFMNALISITKTYPYTYPGYVKHRLCPMRVSGLVVEIADLSHSNDESKVEEFISSINWEFYLNACRSYGFSVDINAPWRLVADIGSTAMLEYAERYLMPSTDEVLAALYTPAHRTYYEGFAKYLEAAYNFLKPPDRYIHTEYCESTGQALPQVITPMVYLEGQLERKYADTDYFLRTYLELRMLEEEGIFTKEEQEKLVNLTIRMAAARGHTEAIDAFEKRIGKTHTYSGSLTDKENRATLRNNELILEEELGNVVSTYR